MTHTNAHAQTHTLKYTHIRVHTQSTRQANLGKASEWAAGAAARPFQMTDLHTPGKFIGALGFFESLSLADLKSECAMHSLPTGSKHKLLKSLREKAKSVVQGNPARGEAPAGVAASGSKGGGADGTGEASAPMTSDLKSPGVAQVRRALVADLRKGLVFDKKLKKGGAKMLRGVWGWVGGLLTWRAGRGERGREGEAERVRVGHVFHVLGTNAHMLASTCVMHLCCTCVALVLLWCCTFQCGVLHRGAITRMQHNVLHCGAVTRMSSRVFVHTPYCESPPVHP